MAKTTTKETRPVDELIDVGRKVWLASLGAFAVVSEETVGMFDELVEKGRTSRVRRETEGVFTRLGEEVEKMGKTVETKMQEGTTATLHRFGVPTRDEIQTLIRRVEQLHTKLEAMAPPAKVN